MVETTDELDSELDPELDGDDVAPGLVLETVLAPMLPPPHPTATHVKAKIMTNKLLFTLVPLRETQA